MNLRLRPVLLGAAVMATATLAAGIAVANAAGSAPTATFTKSSDWGTGYVGDYAVHNGGSAITSWTVTFDLPQGTTVGSFWNATLTQSGTHVVAKNREYNGNLGPDGSTSFGYTATGSGAPTNCLINGGSCGGGTTPQPSPTKPVPSPTKPAPQPSPTKPAPQPSPTTPPSPQPPQPGNGKTVFGPYIHMSVTGRPSLSDVVKNTGAKAISLAFLINQGSCDLKWDGVTAIDAYKGEIDAVKALGATPIVSTGGANGSEAAVGCRTGSATAAQLEKVVALGVRYLDFDVEGGSVGDATANTARGEAIKQLQSKYPDLKASLTLASLPPDKWGTPGGLMDKDQAPYKAAVAAGARIDRVNIMTMDFGTYYDEGKGTTIMGQKSIAAATDLQKQIKAISNVDDATAWKMVGITPMIGVNDTTTEVFQLSNVDELTSFAKAHGVGFLGMWSATRDIACAPGTGQPSPVCSGVSQQRYEFGKRFANAQS
jgi:hypothetical protein